MKERINPYNMFVGSFIPNWLLEQPELSSNAKLVYGRLCQFAGKDGRAFPTIETLSVKTGLSKSTAERALAELKDAKLIDVERHGLNQPNSYFFLRHKWMDGKPDTSPVTYQDTSTLTDQDTSPVTYIRESEEENQLRDPARRAPSAGSLKKSGSGMTPEAAKAHLKQLREGLN